MFLLVWPVLGAVYYFDGPMLPTLLACAVLDALYVAATTNHKWVLLPAMGSIFAAIMLNDRFRDLTSDPLAATVNPLVAFWEVGPYILPVMVLMNTSLLGLYHKLWGDDG